MYEDNAYAPPERRGPSAAATIFIALVVSAATFVGLRMAELRGFLPFLQAPVSDVEVPSIVGLGVAEARDVLKSRGLLLSLEAERPDPKVAAGNLSAQAPLAGSRALAGSAVSAVVSKGPAQAVVPPVTGLVPEDAARALAAQQLQPGPRREEASATVAAGVVIGTDPAAGQVVAPGATVALIVSAGPATKQVPKVVGLSLARARKALEQAGFKPGAVKYGYSDRYDGNVVIKQDPAENAAALPGSEVQLLVTEPD